MEEDAEPQWVVALAQLIAGPELSQNDFIEKEAALVSEIRASGESILQILRPLGHYLTTESDTPRSKAVVLLAKIVHDVPETVRTPSDVHHLAEFFTARLRDWPAIRGALQGCEALMERSLALPQITDSDVSAIFEALIKGVYVRSLSAPDRATALSVLRHAVSRCGQAALDAGVDLLEYCIASIDGEKDPRCLLQAFKAARELLGLYVRQPETAVAKQDLEDTAEEMFDVLSCYFPVSFTPPPNDPHGITRDLIAGELEAALAACPVFAPQMVQLVAEKLSSSLKQAKGDALSLLRACAAAYGPAALREQAPAVWSALKAEIMAPSGEDPQDPATAGKKELAVAAAECLRACTRAFAEAGDLQTFASLILQDNCTSDFLRCVAAPGASESAQTRSVACVEAASAALGALGGAGGEPASTMAAAIFPTLLTAIQKGSEGPSPAPETALAGVMAWAAVASLLNAIAAAPGSNFIDVLGQPMANNLVELCLYAVREGVLSMHASTDERFESNDAWGFLLDGAGSSDFAVADPDRVAWLALRSLGCMFDAQGGKQMPKVEEVLEAVVSAACEGQQQWAGGSVLRSAALSPASAEPLAEVALPALVRAATRLSTSREAALGVLSTLCSANSAVLIDTVVALDQAVQLNLEAAVVNASSAHVALVADVLRTASEIFASSQDSAVSPQCTAAFFELARHTLDAVLLLPSSSEAPAKEGEGEDEELARGLEEVTRRAAEVVYLGSRGAAEAAQVEFGSAAAKAALQFATSSESDDKTSGNVGALQLGVCSATMVALRRGAAAAVITASPPDFLQKLTAAALSNPPPLYLSTAVASFLNKIDSSGSPAAQIVDLVLILGAASGERATASAWAAIAEISRGLSMRGDRLVERIVNRAVESLPDGGAENQAAARSAALFFGGLLSEPEPESAAAPALCRAAHAVIRPLWQQRAYSLASAALAGAIQQRPPATAAPPPSSPSEPISVSYPVLAMAGLLASAPPAVLRVDPGKSFQWVVHCLAALQQQAEHAAVLQALIAVVVDALSSDPGKKEAQAALQRLIPALTGLTAYRPALAVREAALRCLALLTQLPYSSLHQYKREVLRAAIAATDDNKRAVRAAGGLCREVWTSATTVV